MCNTYTNTYVYVNIHINMYRHQRGHVVTRPTRRLSTQHTLRTLRRHLPAKHIVRVAQPPRTSLQRARARS